jgi:ADP-heptose:LPS heptosyltransferase
MRRLKAILELILDGRVTAQTMRSCAAFIGHDSGVTHLAATLDLPGLVL